MNRFTCTDSKKIRHIPGLSIVILALLLIILIYGVSYISEATVKEQQHSLETALQRSVIQCYAVEGTYPPSLDYIKTHYGLTYDEDTFFVDYTIVGSNLLPDITVIRLK